MLQDAVSKKSNNLLLDTSDLAISQYSLLGQTPPRSAPGSPAVARDSSSAAPSEGKEPAPVVGEGGETITDNVCLQTDPERNGDAKSDPSTTQDSAQSTILLSPVIVVTQQFDEPSTEEASCFEETREVLNRTDTASTMDSATAETSDAVTPDSDAAGTHEVGTPDAPADPESTSPIPDSPDLSMSTLPSPQSTDVPAECAQSDQSATPENPAPSDLSTSDQVTEDTASIQHKCPSQPPCADSPMKISLGSLSKAIGSNSAAPCVMQTMAQQTTDRAVYLTGEIKFNWEVERVKEEKQKGAAEEKEVHERIKEEEEETGERKEEEIEGERGEGQMGGAAQIGGEPVDEGCQSSESPAESATTSTTEQRESEEKVDDEEKGSEVGTEKRKDEEELEKEGDHAEKKGKKEKEDEVLLSPQPMEMQSDSVAELPLDSVALIRELVTEVTEVEAVISPCPNSSHIPDLLQ